MYGLIHVALNEMIVSNYSQECWQEIVQRSGVPSDSFMRMNSYDDSVTFALVAATSEVLGAPVNSCLEAFGEFWMIDFAPQSYDSLLLSAGDDLLTFLENLDLLHDRISTTFVGFVPPSFGVQRLENGKAILNYTSARKGLVPFVLGLLKGMQKRFEVELIIEEIEMLDSDIGDKARFHVAFINH